MLKLIFMSKGGEFCCGGVFLFHLIIPNEQRLIQRFWSTDSSLSNVLLIFLPIASCHLFIYYQKLIVFLCKYHLFRNHYRRSCAKSHHLLLKLKININLLFKFHYFCNLLPSPKSVSSIPDRRCLRFL